MQRLKQISRSENSLYHVKKNGQVLMHYNILVLRGPSVDILSSQCSILKTEPRVIRTVLHYYLIKTYVFYVYFFRRFLSRIPSLFFGVAEQKQSEVVRKKKDKNYKNYVFSSCAQRIVGSLSNDDGDGNDNAAKQLIGLMSKNNRSAHAIYILEHFFAVLCKTTT